jgi:hypothetical protein
MADAVTARVVAESPYSYVIHLTNISDGTGESAVTKVNKATIGVASDGSEANSLDIEWVRWNIQGFTSVRILWDHTTDDVALVLAGSGYDDFRGSTPVEDVPQQCSLPDPRSAGTTGSILLTTNGGASGSTYDITLGLRKNPN